MDLEEKQGMLSGGVKPTTRTPPAPGGVLRWRWVRWISSPSCIPSQDNCCHFWLHGHGNHLWAQGSCALNHRFCCPIADCQVNISVAMVAMVNHTAVAAVHSDISHGADGQGIGDDLEVAAGNTSLQGRHLSDDGNATTGQVDGPFVWETTVSWNHLQKWPTKYLCSGARLCAQCLLCWVLYNPGTRHLIGKNIDNCIADSWRKDGRVI